MKGKENESSCISEKREQRAKKRGLLVFLVSSSFYPFLSACPYLDEEPFGRDDGHGVIGEAELMNRKKKKKQNEKKEKEILYRIRRTTTRRKKKKKRRKPSRLSHLFSFSLQPRPIKTAPLSLLFYLSSPCAPPPSAASSTSPSSS